jgi:hypothetical protein
VVSGLTRQAKSADTPLIEWIYEDELPDDYPYHAMFCASKIEDGIRVFPILNVQALPPGQMHFAVCAWRNDPKLVLESIQQEVDRYLGGGCTGSFIVELNLRRP